MLLLLKNSPPDFKPMSMDIELDDPIDFSERQQEPTDPALMETASTSEKPLIYPQSDYVLPAVPASPSRCIARARAQMGTPIFSLEAGLSEVDRQRHNPLGMDLGWDRKTLNKLEAGFKKAAREYKLNPMRETRYSFKATANRFLNFAKHYAEAYYDRADDRSEIDEGGCLGGW